VRPWATRPGRSVALIDGSVDVRSLAVALTVHGNLPEARAHAVCTELLERQLAPGAPAWTLGSWSPIAHRAGPGFGLTHGLFVPVATAHPSMGRALGSAATHAVASLRRWFEEARAWIRGPVGGWSREAGGQSDRCRRSASSSAANSSGASAPTGRAPNRSTAIARTCSA